MASVEFDNVSKTYKGDVIAVRELSMSVRDGEFVVLVGPSGCGKSTALRMVAGLESITSGLVRINGRVMNGVEPENRNVSMVFQSYALYPHMTVYDNLAFGLRMRKTPKAQINARVRDAAKRLGLEALLDRRPPNLSGGQRQRVALGRAIVRHPEVFLMDEPLSNLDAQLRVDTRLEILKLHQSLGATFLYVTHDQVEAMTMGDRIAVMRNGVLQQVDTPRQLYRKPCNLFVASFIGTPSMNFIRMSLEQLGRGLHLRASGIQLPVPEARFNGLRVQQGEELIVGVRADHLFDARFADTSFPRIRCRVEVVETLGSEVLVHSRAGDQQLVAKMEARSEDLEAGHKIEIAIDMDHLHFFDPLSENAIG
jgi:multiple sugar transport system ATP-binding protein